MAKGFFSQPVGFARRKLNQDPSTFTPTDYDDNPRRKFITEEGEEDAPLLTTYDIPEIQDEPVEEGKKLDDNQRPSSPYMPAGDSFRGIGVIIVIFYHMGYERYKNAWFCISLFFSLSGFIMTKSTVESFERHGHVDVYKFWARRVSRLFPVLFLTVVIIMISQIFRVDDGVTFHREKTDLIYATIFMTNYNLAYGHLDDYFDDFATPSVTRHLWTLSIEEQYYIIWPLVLLLLTSAVMSMSKKEYELGRTVDRYAISGTSRRCVEAILILDIVVMALSYVSSMTTIQNHGTTAAYYSTTCRMGDIAAGGFAYSSVRLIPSAARRWYRDPSLPPMTLKLRIVMELMVGALLVSLIIIPMIQTPEDIMLLLYFKYWRLFVSLIIYGVVASTIQLAEPLPSWAIVSRFLSFRPLVLVGVFSYGVYIFHWPLLVYFGDPTGNEKRKVEMGLMLPSDGILGYNGQNVFLFALSMALGYVSFMYFEKPLLLLSKVTMPRKTIFTGFMSMGLTLMTIWFITKDLPPMQIFENDYASLGGSVDSRFTPILVVSRKDYIQRSMFNTFLDYNTRTVTANVQTYDEVVEKYSLKEFRASDAFVIIMCQNLAQRSPCNDPEKWRDKTYWVWLDSRDLCKVQEIQDYERIQPIVQERCEGIISISELAVDYFADLALAAPSVILGVNDAFPGILNQHSMSRVKKDHDRTIGGDEAWLTQMNTGENWDSIRMTMLGESVGVRIAMFWKDYIEMDMPLLNLQDNVFPTISEIKNLAEGGRPAIAYFACLSTHPKYQYDVCRHFDNDKPSIILNNFESSRPNIVVLHDSHWASRDGVFGRGWGKYKEQFGLETEFEKTMAFNIMLDHALKYDVEQFFFITKSPKMRIPKAGYVKEMKLFMQTVDTIACSKGDPSSMRVTVIDWARLVCPGIMNVKYCRQQAHGFDRILNDGIHPYGDSGLWLTREALALLVAEIAKYNLPDKFGSYSSWDEGIENPISKQLLKLAPADGNPLLKDIVSIYYMCPYKDLEALEVKFNQTSFRDYTDYRDSVHYKDPEKESDGDDSDAVSYYGDDTNSNEYLNWYSDAQEMAQRYDHRHFIRGPDPSHPGVGAVIDWTVDETHLHLSVAAPATGWLGFGISDAGGGIMGVDMAFFESGNPKSLRDTYTTDEGKPQTDDCANWELVNAGIKPGYIFFETVRLLDTKDAQDRKITNDSNLLTPPHRVIVAWGNSETVDSIEVNNGRGSIRFFQEEALEPFKSVMEKEAEDSFTVQAVNYQVPNIETNYFHTCVTKADLVARGVPNPDMKKNVIGFEPYIQSSNTEYVHHFLLFAFTSDACGSKEYEPGELIYFWALGYQALALPDFLGLPFNGNELNSFRIQIHYHNPLKQSDIIDSSGVRLYWTSKVRQEEIGLFQVGDPQVRKESTKLGNGLSRHDFECPSSCSETFVGKPVTVIKEVHHMHQTGKQTFLDHFRDGKKIRSGKVEYFDFYYNGFPEVIQEPFTIEPGDTFTMSCFFEDDKGANTIFGLGSKDEMCLGYYIYYPRGNLKKENWMCGYDNRDYHCSASYKRKLLPDEKALGRSFPFGDEGEECTAVS